MYMIVGHWFLNYYYSCISILLKEPNNLNIWVKDEIKTVLLNNDLKLSFE